MRTFHISILTASLLVSLGAKTLKFDDVVVTATKSAKTLDTISSSVFVITKEDIEKSTAIKLKDLLKLDPSIYIQKGGFPSANAATRSVISIRGVGSNGTLFLIDGQRLSGEVKNPYDLDRIPISQIEKIEIIKGPASSLYGSDAYGGVINIITKKDESANVALKGSFTTKGKGRSGELSAGFGQKFDKFNFRVDISALNQDGKTEDKTTRVLMMNNPLPKIKGKQSLSEDVKLYNLNTNFGYTFSDALSLSGYFNYMSEENKGYYISAFHPSNIVAPTPMGKMKVPFFNVPIVSTDDNKRMNFGANLKANLTNELSLDTKLYHSKYKKRNTAKSLIYQKMGFASLDSSMIDPMRANVDITSYESYLQYALKSHFITFGGEYRDERRKATVFTQSNDFNTKKVDYQSLYLQDEFLYDELGFILGVRYDEISNADSKPTFKAGVNYKYNEMLNFRANFAQGYRSPDIRELYISKQTPTGLQVGSEVIRGAKKARYNLLPEFINTYELGFSGNYSLFDYDFALFYNDLEDKITQTKINDYFTFINLKKAYTYGASFNIGLEYEKLKANANFIALDSKDKQSNKKLLYTPENAFRLSAEYNVYDKIWLGASYDYTGVQYYLEDNFRKEASGFGVFDIYANYIKDDFRLYFGISNLADEDGDENVFITQGRSVNLGISYKF